MPNPCIIDSSGQQWILGCDNSAVIVTTPTSGQPGAVGYFNINSVTDGVSFQLTIVPNPPPSGMSWGDILVTQIANNSAYASGISVTAPNGVSYTIQAATVGPPILGSTTSGILQTALTTPAVVGCQTAMSALADNVLSRLEDPDGVFWLKNYEAYTALTEAMNDLMLLVGRPTQTVSLPFNLQPNSVWQTLPKGVLAATNIWAGPTQLRKVTLWDMDMSQSSWASDWSNDSSVSGPTRWFPLGFNLFGVHPAPQYPQTVLIDGIQYPSTESNFPYSGSSIVPFHDEVFTLLEAYAAHYCRVKEGTQEFQHSIPLYQEYLRGAGRLTEIEDVRDNLVFSPSLGTPVGTNRAVQR